MLSVIIILLLCLVHTMPLLYVVLFVLLLGLVCILCRNIDTVISKLDSNPGLCYITNLDSNPGLCYISNLDSNPGVCYISNLDSNPGLCYISNLDSNPGLCYV